MPSPSPTPSRWLSRHPVGDGSYVLTASHRSDSAPKWRDKCELAGV